MADGDIAQKYQEATLRTAGDLVTVATTLELHRLSQLSLPEIEAISSEIARVVPAGNVPGLILSGLVQIEGRSVAPQDSHRFLDMLFRGVKRSLDRMVYGTFFAGPAAVLYAYQQLLRLSGKAIDSAFPDGTWQFYLQFALREDSARHANETIGFQQHLARMGYDFNAVDRLTCWLLAALDMLRELPDILANEWRERVLLAELAKVAAEQEVRLAHTPDQIHRQWEQQRPYKWSSDQATTYAAYRRAQFDEYIATYTRSLNPHAQQTLDTRMSALQQDDLPRYQAQMSWFSYLEPENHSEKRVPYALDEAYIGVIYSGRYFLLPISECAEGHDDMWRLAGAIIGRDHTTPPAELDDVLVTLSRSNQQTVRTRLPAGTRDELDRLRHAPILINWDTRPADQPLGKIREGKRGLGDHPLTIFHTAESTVFDQSHIYFDGAWGAAIAQIMTGQAQQWADTLQQYARPRRARRAIYSPLLQSTADVTREANKARIRLGTNAENTDVNLKALLRLRILLKQRNEGINLTVNDVLVLYRTIHAHRYTISPTLQRALEAERNHQAAAYRATLDAIATLKDKNPSLLIPIDASRQNPRDRVFPTTFRNPLTDFLAYHEQTLAALDQYAQATEGRSARRAYNQFADAQAVYLRMIGGFGELLLRYRLIAMSGQSMSTSSIKFLAHLPAALQSLLDNIPRHFDILNEIIKGEEVFSNVGRVAKGSSLRRFITAKDDNTQKTLAWGVLTDDSGVVRLSLRDFRSYVMLWQAAELPDIAQAVTQDYLDAYAAGLNTYVDELQRILTTQKPPGRLGFLPF